MTLAALIAIVLGGQRRPVNQEPECDTAGECNGSLLSTDLLGVVGTPGVKAGLYSTVGSDNALIPFDANAAFSFSANPCFGNSTLNRVKQCGPEGSIYTGPPFPPRNRRNILHRISREF